MDFNLFCRKGLCIHLTCNGLFEFVFSAHRGMERFIFGSVAVGHGWCSTGLSYQQSFPCCTLEGELYESFNHRSSPGVKRLHVHIEFSALIGCSTVFLYCVCASIA